MAAFSVDIRIGEYIPTAPCGADNSRLANVSAQAGTGAVFSMFPASLLARLGVVAHREQAFVDGATHAMGTALIAIGKHQAPCPVIFGPEGRFVLGKLALENLFLEIDDAGKNLVPKKYSLLVGIIDDEAPLPNAPAALEVQ